MSLRIVRAGPEDAFLVAALSLQFAVAVDGVREEGYVDRAGRHWLAHHKQLPTWIAQRGGTHAGYLQATFPPETTWPGEPIGTRGRLSIHALFVVRDHRRAGVGSALLASCESWARGAGVGVIHVQCEPGAEEFCDASGYTPERTVREKRLSPLR